MGLFKKHKPAIEIVTVKGEKFTLTEPNALEMCDFFELQEVEFSKVDKNSSVKQRAKLYTKVGFQLVAYCLMRHFNPSLDDGEIVETSSNIYRMLCREITDMDDANRLNTAAEKVSGMKLEETEVSDKGEETSVLKLEQTELQDESLETD